MNASQLAKYLGTIAETSSRLKKEEMLERFRASDIMKNAFRLAYDPTVTFGIDDVPKRDKAGALTDIPYSGWQLLDDLRYRRVTGEAARSAVRDTLNLLDEGAGWLFTQIIKKDLRCGVGEGTINKVWPGLLPEFPYMRCSLPDKSNLSKWNWSDGMYSQEKADGMFVNVNYLDDDQGTIDIYSRTGSHFPESDEFDDIKACIRKVLTKGYQYHGELVVLRHGVILPREDGNGQLNSVMQGGRLDEHCDVRLVLWDNIPMAAVKLKGKWGMAYQSRLHYLETLIEGLSDREQYHLQVIETKVCYSPEEAQEHCRELLAKGKEGTIVKHPGAIWKDGTSKDQVKFKLEVDVDLEVIDFIEGEGKYEGTLGALVMASKCGKLRVNVNGRTDALRDEIWNNKLDWLGAIGAVRANNVMKPGDSSEFYSLFLPRWVERRLDKVEADDLQQILDQFAGAVTGDIIEEEA